jgi:hypothetical protein
MHDSPPQTTNRNRLTVNVEMDDRTFLFPDGKFLSHILVGSTAENMITLDGVFHFNGTRSDPRFCVLDLDDARELSRKLIDAFYQGRTQHVITDTVRIAIVFNPNGFVVQFGELRSTTDLFINPPSVLRLTQGLLRVIDSISPVLSH